MSEKVDNNYRQGKFKPKNPEKYKGDPTRIIYRSSYEYKMLEFCDLNETVLEYRSEEVAIPYISPLDGRYHRYFPDIIIKYKDSKGNIRKALIEIKPQKDLIEPEKNPKRKTKSWVYKVKTWAVNQAKFAAAREWCKDRGYEFRIFTEKELGIKK